MADGSATDKCDETPLKLMFPLPPTCKVNLDDVMASTVDIGRCNMVPCETQSYSPSDTMCCMPGNTRALLAECEGFSYEINQITSCECAACAHSNKVLVSGRVNNVDVEVTESYVLYDDISYDVTNSQFLFEATPMAGRVTFHVKSRAFMSQLVTLDVSEGLTQMYVEVTVVAKPTPFVVDVATGAELTIVSTGLSSAVSVIIPQDSFHDENVDEVSGTVNVFLSFSDPRKLDGLDAAPGQFTFQDPEGVIRPLKTFGVVTMEAEDTDGNEVFLTKKITLKVDAGALGITPAETVSLWTIDGVSGQWQKSGTLTSAGSGRRRRQTSPDDQLLYAQTELPRNLPFINLDIEIDDTGFCSVAVQLYYGEDFAIPYRIGRVVAYSVQNGQLTGTTTAVSDMNGRACISVMCGVRQIVKLRYYQGTIVHSTHFLPAAFPFTNTANGFDIVATPPASQVGNAGPVFPSSDTCLDPDSPSYHFKLALNQPQPPLYASLNADDRWFPIPPTKWQACAFLVILNVRIAVTIILFLNVSMPNNVHPLYNLMLKVTLVIEHSKQAH